MRLSRGLRVQKRAANAALEPAAAESLFREHVLELQKRAADAYLELLEEVLAWPLSTLEPSMPAVHLPGLEAAAPIADPSCIGSSNTGTLPAIKSTAIGSLPPAPL